MLQTSMEARVSKAPAKSNIEIHEFLSRQLDIAKSMGKTQRDIAAAIGYEKPNPLNMMKTGAMKVPLDKVPGLARALNVDPAFLMRLAMNQYWPDATDAIASVFGTVLTNNERHIVEFIRAASDHTDPSLNRDLERALKAAFKQ